MKEKNKQPTDDVIIETGSRATFYTYLYVYIIHTGGYNTLIYYYYIFYIYNIYITYCTYIHGKRKNNK